MSSKRIKSDDDDKWNKLYPSSFFGIINEKDVYELVLLIKNSKIIFDLSKLECYYFIRRVLDKLKLQSPIMCLFYNFAVCLNDDKYYNIDINNFEFYHYFDMKRNRDMYYVLNKKKLSVNMIKQRLSNVIYATFTQFEKTITIYDITPKHYNTEPTLDGEIIVIFGKREPARLFNYSPYYLGVGRLFLNVHSNNIEIVDGEITHVNYELYYKLQEEYKIYRLLTPVSFNISTNTKYPDNIFSYIDKCSLYAILSVIRVTKVYNFMFERLLLYCTSFSIKKIQKILYRYNLVKKKCIQCGKNAYNLIYCKDCFMDYL